MGKSWILWLALVSMAGASNTWGDPVGELRLSDGRVFLIEGFLPGESAEDYYVRSGKRYVSLAQVRELARIDAGLTDSRHYQLTLASGDWRDFASNVFLFRRVVYQNPEGKWGEAFVPVLKDRGSAGFRFIALTGSDGQSRYVEIANPGEISSLEFYAPAGRDLPPSIMASDQPILEPM